MTVEYSNTMDDIVAFSIFHSKHSPTQWRRLLIQRILFPAFLIIFLFFRNLGEPPINFVIALLIALPIILVWEIFLPMFVRRSIAKNTRKLYEEGKNKGLTGKHTITLFQDSIMHESETDQSKTSWAGIERIVKNVDSILIYVGALNAYVIPRRAFFTQNEFEDFYNEANTLWKKATH